MKSHKTIQKIEILSGLISPGPTTTTSHSSVTPALLQLASVPSQQNKSPVLPGKAAVYCSFSRPLRELTSEDRLSRGFSDPIPARLRPRPHPHLSFTGMFLQHQLGARLSKVLQENQMSKSRPLLSRSSVKGGRQTCKQIKVIEGRVRAA